MRLGLFFFFILFEDISFDGGLLYVFSKVDEVCLDCDLESDGWFGFLGGEVCIEFDFVSGGGEVKLGVFDFDIILGFVVDVLVFVMDL